MLRSTHVIVNSLPPCEVFYLRSAHSERFKMDAQTWPFRKIGYLEAGSGVLEFDDYIIPVKAGDLYCIAANLRHRIVDDKGHPCTVSMVCYDERRLSFFKDIHSQMLKALPEDDRIAISDPWQKNYLSEHFRRYLLEQNQAQSGYEDLLRVSVIELITFILRQAQQDNPNASSTEKMIKGLIDYLNKNFNKDILLDELADICNVSTRSLSRHFKEYTGKTVVQYITDLRIDYACKRIRETGQISFSAMDAGFNDISFFYRTFKRYKGMTPKEFLSKNK